MRTDAFDARRTARSPLLAALGVVVVVVVVGSLAGCGMVSVSRSPRSARPGTVTTTPVPSTSHTSPSDGAPAGPVIVIDPGHSGRWTETRTTNGLRDVDYPTEPEMTEVFAVGTCVASALRTDGYRVVLTKRHVGDTVSLTERARIADRADAALAVSIHDDHSQDASFQAVYSQRGLPSHGGYPTMYRGSGASRTVFDNPRVATSSDRAAKAIAAARSVAQGRTVRLAQNSFTGRAPLEPGNLALVQLLSRVPWVYNEAGAGPGPMSLSARTGYAVGLVNGIEAAVPMPARSDPGPASASASASALRSCLEHAG